MRGPSQLAARARPTHAAAEIALLGSEHPLVLATDALESVKSQCLLIAAVLAGSGIACIAGQAWAAPVALGASVVLAILGLIAAGLHQSRRDRAIDLILEGHENLPIDSVQHQRERLLSKRSRHALARTFEDMIELASHPPKLQTRGARPLFQLRVVSGTSNDLLEVIRLLHADPVSARGVARAERVITDATSALYGHDPSPLRAELRRVHSQLSE